MKGDLLVIEDDVSLNRVLVSHLNEEGFTAEGVKTWADAQGYLRMREPKLVIMDIRLPDTDGMERLPDLAAEQPVIVLTAYGSINDAVAAVKAGAADYRTAVSEEKAGRLTVGADAGCLFCQLGRSEKCALSYWQSRKANLQLPIPHCATPS